MKKKYLIFFLISVFCTVVLSLLSESSIPYKESFFSSVTFVLFFATFIFMDKKKD